MLEILLIIVLIVLIFNVVVNVLGTLFVFFTLIKAGGYKWLKDTFTKSWNDQPTTRQGYRRYND